MALRQGDAGFVVGLQTATPQQLTNGLGAPSVDHLSFAVADLAALRALVGKAAQGGIDLSDVYEEAASFNVRGCDPDGVVIELTAPKPR